jgi:hypothetical protein
LLDFNKKVKAGDGEEKDDDDEEDNEAKEENEDYD